MDKIIKQIYQNAVDNTGRIKKIDQNIDKKLRHIASLYPKCLSAKEKEDLSDATLDILFYTKEAMFILGFKYATELWTEALIDSREGKHEGDTVV